MSTMQQRLAEIEAKEKVPSGERAKLLEASKGEASAEDLKDGNAAFAKKNIGARLCTHSGTEAIEFLPLIANKLAAVGKMPNRTRAMK